MRRRLPTANELVWDNYNFFVIGYSPTESPTDSIFSIAARANGVGVCFIRGASLPDPKGLLLGSGRQTRFIRVEAASELSHPDVAELIDEAIARATNPCRQWARPADHPLDRSEATAEAEGSEATDEPPPLRRDRQPDNSWSHRS